MAQPRLSALRARGNLLAGGLGAGRAAPALVITDRGRRVAAAVAVLGLGLLLALLIFAFSGGEAPPATGAASLVPSDAMLYVHLSTDPSRPAVKRAQTLMGRLPDHGAAVNAFAQRLMAVVGGSPSTDYGRDIRPWLGKEAAFALLNTAGSSAGSVIVLDVRNHRLAQSFVTRAGAQPSGTYRGSALYTYPTGAEFAFVDGFMVVGLDSTVRAAIDAADGRVRALADNPAYQRASGDEPDGRVLDAYLSAAGVNRLLGSRSGVLGALSAVLAKPELLGAAISVSATDPGLRVYVHSALDPTVAKGDRTRLQSFSPTLSGVLPSGSTLMLDTRNLADAAPTVLRAIGQIGLLSGVPDLLHRLGAALTAQRIDVRRVLSIWSGETAVALAAGSGAPALVIVTRTDDETKARVGLATLEAPLTQIFSAPESGAGVAPEVSDVPVGGVTAHQLQLGPGLQLDYAVFRGLIVVATSVRGIGDVAARSRALENDPGYQTVLRDRADDVTSLGFADFSQLLSLAGQTALNASAGYAALAPDLQRIHAVGMSSTGGESDTTAELSLQIP